MLDDYFAEFRSLHSELQHLLDNAEAGGAAPQVGIDAKMREIKEIFHAGRLFTFKRPVFTSKEKVEMSVVCSVPDCLGALEMEVRSLSPPQRSTYYNQLQKCRDDFAMLQRRCLLLTSHGQKNTSLAERMRCGQALEKLNSANAQLESTRKLAEETEEVGANILCNLYMQRESIQRANRHAEETNANLRESSSLITKMGKWWSGLIG